MTNEKAIKLLGEAEQKLDGGGKFADAFYLAAKALGKQIPQKLIPKSGRSWVYLCPSCKMAVSSSPIIHKYIGCDMFCFRCGQALDDKVDWSEEQDDSKEK